MTNFATDADLVRWEPALLRDLAIPGQRLAAGLDGATSGLQFTSAGAHLVAAGVAPGHVLRLADADGDECGGYEVLSVEAETSLLATHVGRTVADAVDLPAGTGWVWTIDTFDPQAAEARLELLARLGLDTDAVGEAQICDRRELRRAGVFATLVMIFEGQAAAGPEGRNLAAKAALYRRLYDRELSKLRVRLDRDGDGVADDVRAASCVRLERR
jgi:hypothetical protein